MNCRFIQLTLFIAITISVPLLLRLQGVYNSHYKTGLVEELRLEEPEILLIGNSMLYTRIDMDELRRISGKRISWLTKSGGASACWYLYLKNIVKESGVQPAHVVIFFRDTVLTSPAYRTTGQYGDYLRMIQSKEDPVIKQVLASNHLPALGLSAKIKSFYEIDSQPRVFQSSVHDLALDITKINLTKKERKDDMNTRFSVDNLRHDLALENVGHNTSGTSRNETTNFSADPNTSFLPHIMKLAQNLNTNLIFYQVQNTQERKGRPLPEDYTSYLVDLKNYLQLQNALTLEEEAGAIPPNWFAEGDHISKNHRAEYTRLFWKKIKGSLLVTK